MGSFENIECLEELGDVSRARESLVRRAGLIDIFMNRGVKIRC